MTCDTLHESDRNNKKRLKKHQHKVLDYMQIRNVFCQQLTEFYGDPQSLSTFLGKNLMYWLLWYFAATALDDITLLCSNLMGQVRRGKWLVLLIFMQNVCPRPWYLSQISSMWKINTWTHDLVLCAHARAWVICGHILLSCEIYWSSWLME